MLTKCLKILIGNKTFIFTSSQIFIGLYCVKNFHYLRQALKVEELYLFYVQIIIPFKKTATSSLEKIYFAL